MRDECGNSGPSQPWGGCRSVLPCQAEVPFHEGGVGAKTDVTATKDSISLPSVWLQLKDLQDHHSVFL
jgi:hypothetical protein